MLLIDGKKLLLLKPNSCICNQWRLIHDSVRHAKTGRLQMTLTKSVITTDSACVISSTKAGIIVHKSSLLYWDWGSGKKGNSVWKIQVFCTRCVQPGSLAVHVLILRHMVTRWQSSSKKNAFSPCRDADFALILAMCSGCFELKTMVKHPNSSQLYQNIH